MRQILLQNATAIWLQNAQKFIAKCVRFFITKCDSFILKCDSYYKFRRFYYKMRQLLQNVTFMTNCDSTILLELKNYTIKIFLIDYKFIFFEGIFFD